MASALLVPCDTSLDHFACVAQLLAADNRAHLTERAGHKDSLVAVPDVGCQLPVAADLLPDDNVFVLHVLRLLALGLQAEGTDLTSSIAAERLHVHSRELEVADLLGRLHPI